MLEIFNRVRIDRGTSISCMDVIWMDASSLHLSMHPILLSHYLHIGPGGW